MAGTIDQLNFEVIISDAKFDAKIKEVEAKAKQFNTSLSNLLNINKISTKMSQKDVENARRINQAKVDETRAQEKINREKIKTEGLQRKINAQIDRATRGYNTQKNTLSDLSGLAMQYFSFRGITSLISSIVRVTGELELQKTTLAAMLDDMGAAEHIMTKIKALAVESPFQFKELATYAKQLSAFSVPKEELFDTVNMIADLSAGLGVSADRLILAYGQVKSAAFLRGQEVRQFTEAGIPLLQELAEEFSALEERVVSTGEVFDKISTRQVPFEMVAKVLKDMTSEGGKFFQMQQIQSDTLWGKVRKLKDAWEIALGEIGKKNGTVIHGVLDTLISMAKNWERVGNILRTLIITYGVYKAALLAAWVVEKAIVTVEMAKHFIQAIKGVKGLSNAMTFLRANLSSILGFFGILGGLIYAFSTSAGDAADETYNLNEELKKIHSQSVTLADALDRDIAYLQSLTKGTENYRNAVLRINELYKEYLPSLIREADSYDDIAKKAEQAKKAVVEKSRQEALTKAREAVDRKWDGVDWRTNYDKLYEDFRKKFGEPGVDFLNKFFSDAIEKGVNGISADDLFKESFKRYFNISHRDWNKYFEDYYFHHGRLSLMMMVEQYVAYNKEIEEAYKRVNELYTEASWTTYNEYKVLTSLANERDKKLAEISAKEMSDSEHRKEALKVEKEYLSSLIDYYDKVGNTTMALKYKKDLEALEDFWKMWRGKVQNLLSERGYKETSSFGLWTTDATSSKDYAEKLVKDYKEVTETIDSIKGFDPNTTKKLEEQKKIIEEIAALLNVDLNPKKNRKNDKSKIEAQIDALQTLKRLYDEFKELGVSDSSITTLLEGYFPKFKELYGDDFISQLDFAARLIKKAEQLKKTEPEKANSILSSLGLDEAGRDKKRIKETNDALVKYYETLRKWKTGDFSIEGEGVVFDIGKVASQLTEKIDQITLKSNELRETFNKIDLKDTVAIEAAKTKFEKEFGEGTWDAFFKEFKEKGDKAFSDLADREIAYEKKIAQERVNDFADKYVKESTKGLSLKEWGDKSIRQISDIQEALRRLIDTKISFSPDLLQKLKDADISLDEFSAAVREALVGEYNETITEKFKKIQKAAKNTVSILGDIGGTFASFGDAFDNDILRAIGKYLGVAEEIVSTIVDCEAIWDSIADTQKEIIETTSDIAEETLDVAKSGKDLASSFSIVTMAVKVVLIIAEQIAGAISKSVAAQRELNMVALEYSKIMHEKNLNLVDTIFGENFIGKLKEQSAYIAQARKNIEDLYNKVGDRKFVMLGRVDLKSIRELYGFDESDILEFMDFLKTNRKGIENSRYLKLASRSKKDLDQLLQYYEEYEAALEGLKSTTQEIFGSLADDITSNMLEAFLQTEDAASNLGEVFENLGETIFKSLMQSWVLNDILAKYEDQATKILALMSAGVDERVIAEQLDAMADNIEMDLKNGAVFFERLAQYFQDRSLLPESEIDTQDLADGIKGITEDTANLLASYLNAIRADVSYSKTIWERMDASTQSIAAALAGFSAPILMEYQAQIAANTYNTALHTQTIMQDLQRVIATEGGYTGIRTLS